MITHVAIIYNGVTHSLPKPNRHHHILNVLSQVAGQDVDDAIQGFLDDKGNFLDRAQAWDHAKACGQIIRDFRKDDNWLYSENLW